MISTNRTPLALATTLMLAVFAPVAAQEPAAVAVNGQTATLHVSEPRPLAAALYALSQQFGWRFGFEEARLRYRGDLVDMTSPKYVPKSADDRAYFPRGGVLNLTFTLPAKAGQSEDLGHVVQQLLAEYHARGFPGRYSFIVPKDASGYICIFPEAAADESGSSVPQGSIIKRSVTVGVREGQSLEIVLRQVLNQLAAAAGTRVLFGGVAMNKEFQPVPPSFKTTEEPAYVFLNRTASTLDQRFWQVLWDPTGRFYVLGYGH